MTALSFTSKQFDIASEPKSPINPIYGYSLAEFLLKEFKALGYETDNEPNAEDWGWYFYTEIDAQSYMIGTIAHVDIDPETDAPIIGNDPIEFIVQFDKNRSLKEMLFRKNKFLPDDPIVEKTESILRNKIFDIGSFSKES